MRVQGACSLAGVGGTHGLELVILREGTDMTPVFYSQNVDFFSSARMPQNRTLFLLGGRPPDAGWLRDLVDRNSPDVWAVDSGAGICRRAGVVPRVMIGDMDSVGSGDREWAVEHGAVEHRHPRAKDLTDFQLALQLLREESPDSLLLLSGCFGGRLDHLFSVVNTFAASGSLCMADEIEGLFLMSPKNEVRAVFKSAPLAVSLLPLSEECKGVSIKGVRWPLSDAALSRSYPCAVSNETEGDVHALCEEGLLGLYWRSSQK
jgi:thiamine pyrophosphokinase